MTESQNLDSAGTTCFCGCGQAVQGKKSVYRPGHDARHAGVIARNIFQYGLASQDDYLVDLPTEPLRSKARAMAARLTAKAQAKTEASLARTRRPARAPEDKGILTPAPEVVDPVPFTVKVGRWEYPAKTQGGQSFRNTKRDGSGEWVPFVQK